MGIFKKADAEIRVRVFQVGGLETRNKTEHYGSTFGLWSGFRAICEAMLSNVQQRQGDVMASIFASQMERSLKEAMEKLGIKDTEKMLDELLGETKEGGAADA